MIDTFTLWCLVAGALLIVMALSGEVVKRLPLTTAIIYLGAGFALGPPALGLIDLDPTADAAFVERVTEIVVLVSLFTAGLKLRMPWRDPRWRLPVSLAFASMVVTVGLIAVIGVAGLGLSWGAAVLLGAILAPTDPVLASDVQVAHATDRDRVRFGLTGEAGLNDGAAFPFVMLGLGLLDLHDLGTAGSRWLAIDVVWATLAGLAIGAGLGTAIGHLVVYLRRHHREAVGTDDFLALGLIALAYGAAILAHGYGFLAVFAAGSALRRIEHRATGHDEEPGAVVARATTAEDVEDPATDAQAAPAVMAETVLGFNEQLERIGEVAIVLLVGGMLWQTDLPWEAFWFAPVLFLVIRPMATWLGLRGAEVSPVQRRLIGWFGIRGIGSIYYLTYAIAHGLPDPLADRLAGLTIAVVTTSIVVHGISVTPLMERYGRNGG